MRPQATSQNSSIDIGSLSVHALFCSAVTRSWKIVLTSPPNECDEKGSGHYSDKGQPIRI